MPSIVKAGFQLPIRFLIFAILSSLPQAQATAKLPFLNEPNFHTGNTAIGEPQFLTDNIVKFSGNSGISIWRIDTGEEILAQTYPSEIPVIDYLLDSKTRLLLDSGKLYLKSGDAERLHSIGDSSVTYSQAQFTPDGSGIIAIGSKTSPAEKFAERIATSDGSRTWIDIGTNSSQYLLLAKTNRIAKLERSQNASWHDQLTLLDGNNGQTLATGNVEAALAADFSKSYIDPQHRLIVFSGTGNATYFLNAISNTFAEANYGSLGYYAAYHSPETSKDASRIILRLGNGSEPIRIINTLTGETILDVRSIPLDTSQFFQTSFNLSPDGASLYILSAPGKIEKWDLASNSSKATFTHTNVPFTHILPSPDGSTLLAARSTGREDDYIVAFNTSDRTVRYPILRRFALTLAGSGYITSPSESLHIAPNGKYFYFSSSNSTSFFDLQNGTPLDTLPATNGLLLGATFVEDRSSYLLLYKNGVVEERSKTDFTLIQKGLYPNLRYAEKTLFDSQTGRLLISVGGGLHAIDPFTGELLWSDPDFGFEAGFYNFGAAGIRFILSDPNGTSGVFDIVEKKFVFDFASLANGGAWEQAISPDGSRYARITSDLENSSNRRVEVYAIPNSELLYTSESFPNIRGLHFLNDSKRIAFIASQNSFRDPTPIATIVDSDSAETENETTFNFPTDQTIATTSLSSNDNRLLVLTLSDSFLTIDFARQAASQLLSLRNEPINYYRNSSLATNDDGTNYLFIDRNNLADGGQIKLAQILKASIALNAGELTVSPDPDAQANHYQFQTSQNLIQWINQGNPLSSEPNSKPSWIFTPTQNTPLFGRILGFESD